MRYSGGCVNCYNGEMMADFTPDEEYCHCGDLKDYPHTCGGERRINLDAHPKFKPTGKTTITLPTEVPVGFTIELPASENGWIVQVPAYQQLRRKD
jgi:hypothetical protein